MDSGALLQLVRGHLDATRWAAVDAGGLGAVLATGLAAVHSRWPTAPAPDADFAAYLADRLTRPADLAAVLPRLRVEDLYLAAWCRRGDPDGIRAFEAAFADDLDKLVARFHRLPAAELRQRLRIKLFVGDASAPPRIAEYAGFGFLQNWLRVTAARLFVDVARSDLATRYEEELDEHALVGLGASADPRLAHLREALGGAVKRGFAAAVASLAPRQRTFLRHAYVDRLTLDQIAATYSVHRATVARTLATGREHLIEHTRAAVARALGVEPEALTSAIAELDTHLELSLSRVLQTPRAP
ncbi:MAG: hypothetical protein IPL61_24225 [Myxococcales bacterium]|nr:hypothetical protein [Myxococcales bacterium]